MLRHDDFVSKTSWRETLWIRRYEWKTQRRDVISNRRNLPDGFRFLYQNLMITTTRTEINDDGDWKRNWKNRKCCVERTRRWCLVRTLSSYNKPKFARHVIIFNVEFSRVQCVCVCVYVVSRKKVFRRNRNYWYARVNGGRDGFNRNARARARTRGRRN